MAPITLRDVAERAGVSISTASRALSDDRSRPVAAETQTRVWDAAHALGYEPNLAAQSLKQGDGAVARATYNIGLILGNVSYKFADPFWAPVLNGVDQELTRQEYHLRFAYTVDDLMRRHQRRLISRTHIDGLILAARVRPFTQAIGPERTVVIEDDETRWSVPLPVDVVAIEKRRSMYALVDHLAALGRRRFGFLGPPAAIDERAEAFVQALARREIAFDPSLFVVSPWPAEGAYTVAMDLLSRRAHDLDALVCACDTIAIGAIRAAKECGVHLPDDLAVTGFDDIPFARDLDPPLTTVHVPKEMMGAIAARKLIERIDHPDLPPVIQVVPTALIVRSSCGAQMRRQVVSPTQHERRAMLQA